MAQFVVFFATAQGAGVRTVDALDAVQAETLIRRETAGILRVSVVAMDWMGDLDRKAMLREWMDAIRNDLDSSPNPSEGD